MRTDRMERISHPDGYSKKKGDCGDMVGFFLKGNKERVESVAFMVQGCMNTVADFTQGQFTDNAWTLPLNR